MYATLISAMITGCKHLSKKAELQAPKNLPSQTKTTITHVKKITIYSFLRPELVVA
jgi:hypothetical protein